MSESGYPAALATHIGYVVLEAAEVEAQIGELIVLHTGRDSPDPSWWASGETLAKAIEKIGDPELQPIADEMRKLLPHRNAIVHGLFPGYGRSRMTLKRAKGKKGSTPSFELAGEWTDEALEDLARRFRAMLPVIDHAIREAIGLPPRT
ncbi:MAG: hypothetical protein WBA38_17510 [Gordonia sp. (in: high G+C Gram-positive bacteria)]|uniref:hypothetical protein n=1 Tax=Gordonia sp. (in: high G+C Gram-positive bacteria) TaxID=84139 RepID=UPI003C75D8EC